jgi:nicotinate phosphoribosyltransferase
MTGHGGPALGLYTDLYELRMVESYLRRGMTAPATFSLYIRPTPERPWFVALGVHRVLEFLDRFRYGDAEIAYLHSVGIGDETLDFLRSFQPSGEVWAVPDGTVVLADEPILEVDAPLPVAQLIETAVINLVQLPTLVATKAARIALAAQGRPVVDFGFRRAHGLDTGVEAALAAHVGGGLTTSNVEAGRRYGIPVVGTMAHSFVQAFEDETEAFHAFAEDHPDDCVLLVDTYDTIAGVRNAITVASEMREHGRELRAVRLDSGDLADLARRARAMLDDAGFPLVQIFASGGLDETKIAALVLGEAPMDAFGVGTGLVVSADRPAVDIAYKLVSYGGRPVAKFSTDKASLPGAKQVFRADGDVLALREERLAGDPLLRPVWRDGEPRVVFDLDEARERTRVEIEALPVEWKRLPYKGEPPGPRLSDELRVLAADVSAGRSSALPSRFP